MDLKIFFSIFVFIYLIEFISAASFGYNNPTLPKLNSPVTTAITTTTNNNYYNTSDHNNLSGLQGGSTNEYYHLNSSVYTYLLSNLWNFLTGNGNPFDQSLNTTDNVIFNSVNTTNMNIIYNKIVGAGISETAQYLEGNYSANGDTGFGDGLDVNVFDNTNTNQANYGIDALYFVATANGTSSGKIGFANGLTGYARNKGAGNVTNVIGLTVAGNNEGAGSVTSTKGIYVQALNNGGGSVTNAYGIFIAAVQGTNNYGIYQSGNSLNYFTGNMSVPNFISRSDKFCNSTDCYSLSQLLNDTTGTGNSSWNESYANSLYSNISWNYNQTTAAFNNYNSSWDNSWINPFNDTWINHTNIVYSLWNSIWISTYNSTYAGYATNVSINYTKQTYDTYDTRWNGGNSSWNESYASDMYVQNNSGTAGYIPLWQNGNTINNSAIIQEPLGIFINMSTIRIKSTAYTGPNSGFSFFHNAAGLNDYGIMFQNNGTSILGIQSDYSTYSQVFSNLGDLRIGVPSNAQQIVIKDTTNYVGIGTTNPLHDLTIQTAKNTTMSITSSTATSGFLGIIFGYLDSSYQKGAIYYKGQDGYARGSMIFALEPTAASDNVGLSNAIMTLNYSGNVLIGSSADNGKDKLQVNGNGNFRGIGNFSGTIYINNNTDISTLGNSSWNESFAHILFDTTYNATYDTTTKEWNGNKTSLIGCVNNNSYLSTYNVTYVGYSFGARNETLDTYNNWNSAWISTYNVTYDGSVNNASYLSTYNTTYAGAAFTGSANTFTKNQTINNVDSIPATIKGGNLEIYSGDITANNKGGSIAFGGFDTSLKIFGQIAGRLESTNNGYISFATLNNSNFTEKVRITANGSLLIGTTEGNSHKLTVKGNVNITNNITIGETIKMLRYSGALPVCGTLFNASMAANLSGLYWCNTTASWTRIVNG